MLMSGKTFIENRNFTLSGDDYTNWGNNDKYITDYVINALKATPTPTPTPT
jgi:hypothetical protein